MSTEIAIRVEGLSKRYRIGARERRAATLRETLKRALHSPFDYLRTTLRPPTEEEVLWALRDISFEVERGAVVGLIGPNGAGKSTLLKVLSRITEPTEGRAILEGRVSSLLEVGTGFHRELTGRDNVYLNGAILGMSRREIGAKFDEIVGFAGLETFIDTPVKRYSSGMQVRLAFAVAAHLDPEILLVDEVLAVGDAEFRKKCLGKMDEVAKGGRTLLFVSHNMGVVRDLCPTSLWIDHGRVVTYGPSAKVIKDYLARWDEQVEDAACTVFPEEPDRDFQVLRVRLLDRHGEASELFDCDQPIVIELLCRLRQPITDLVGQVELSRQDGTVVLYTESRDHLPNILHNLPLGDSLLSITVPPRTLAAGDYRIHAHFEGARGMAVESPGMIGSLRLEDDKTFRGNGRPGFLSTILPWTIRESTGEVDPRR